MVNNQLHLHFTQLQQFTKDNFQIILEATLRWVFPIALGQAAKLVTLPDIQEEEEDVEGEYWRIWRMKSRKKMLKIVRCTCTPLQKLIMVI